MAVVLWARRGKPAARGPLAWPAGYGAKAEAWLTRGKEQAVTVTCNLSGKRGWEREPVVEKRRRGWRREGGGAELS